MDFKSAWLDFLLGLEAKNIKNICIGIGVFDGVHPGHVKLLETLRDFASSHGSYPVALTFSPHPRNLLQPQCPTKLLVPLEKRIELLKKHGAEEVFIIDFNENFSNIMPADFLQLLASSAKVKTACITVGKNWRFGKNSSGDTALVQQFCYENNITFQPIDELKIDNEKISSANIRLAISNGLLDKARSLLGRDFTICGRIVKGFSFAGDKLGHPTANLVPDSEILPPDGVYGAKVIIDDIEYLAAVNIGVAPSFEFNKQQHRIEVHLLDFNGNLYGRKLEVKLLKHLRNERFFESAEALKAQIILDIQQIKNLK